MFQDLSQKINLQNLNKIKHLAKKSRYPEDQPQDNSHSHEYQDSELDDLHIELKQRQENFNRFHQKDHQQQPLQLLIKRDHSTPPSLHRKLQNQLQLAQERLKLQRADHERQLQYQEQLYKRREQWLQVENSKLKCMVKKYKQESAELKEMRAIVRRAEEVRDVMEGRLEGLGEENRELKRQVDRLRQDKAKILENQNKELLTEGNDKQKNNKLTTRILVLEQQLAYEKSVTEQKRKKIERMSQQITKSRELVIQKEKECDDEIRKLNESHNKREQELAIQMVSLRKRNQHLQQTFMQKMSEITRLQAHILSNTSQNSSHSVSAHIVRHSRTAEETINLQEESPIKPAPQPINFSEKKPVNSKKMTPMGSGSENNPEQQLQPHKNNTIQTQCLCCSTKIQKYKQKLSQANKKILELLSQKVQTIRAGSKTKLTTTMNHSLIMNPNNPNNTTKRCPHAGSEQCCTRTRISSWKQA